MNRVNDIELPNLFKSRQYKLCPAGENIFGCTNIAPENWEYKDPKKGAVKIDGYRFWFTMLRDPSFELSFKVSASFGPKARMTALLKCMYPGKVKESMSPQELFDLVIGTLDGWYRINVEHNTKGDKTFANPLNNYVALTDDGGRGPARNYFEGVANGRVMGTFSKIEAPEPAPIVDPMVEDFFPGPGMEMPTDDDINF